MDNKATKNISTKGIWRALLSVAIVFMLFQNSDNVSAKALRDMKMSANTANISKQEIISAYELHKILTDHFGFVNIKLSDANYTLPDVRKLDNLAESNYCNPQSKISKNDWGNDDYAMAALVPMRNYAFGAVYVASADGDQQLMNIYINHSKEVVYMEPKTCENFSGQIDKPEFIFF